MRSRLKWSMCLFLCEWEVCYGGDLAANIYGIHTGWCFYRNYDLVVDATL